MASLGGSDAQTLTKKFQFFLPGAVLQQGRAVLSPSKVPGPGNSFEAGSLKIQGLPGQLRLMSSELSLSDTVILVGPLKKTPQVLLPMLFVYCSICIT